MLVTSIMAGVVGLGVGNIVMNIFGDEDHSLEGKMQLIFKRCDICIEKKESGKPKEGDRRKLYPTLVKKTFEGENHNYVLYYKLPVGLSFIDILEKLHYICDGLNAEVIPKQLEGDIKSDFRLTVLRGHLKDKIIYTNEHTLSKKDGIYALIGWSRRGFEQINLANSNTCDMLVAGVKGSGKSTLLRLIGTSFVLNYTPDELNLWLCDFKMGVEFEVFGNTRLVTSKITKTKDAINFFAQLLMESDVRYEMFKDAGCVDIDEFNQQYPDKKIPHIVMMLDELAMLQNDQKAMIILTMLGAVGRASGIHMILSTQRPDSKVIDSNLKNNIAVTVGLRCKNAISSRVVMGEKDSSLARIDPDTPGRCKIQHSKELYAQVPELTTKMAKQLCLPYEKNHFDMPMHSHVQDSENQLQLVKSTDHTHQIKNENKVGKRRDLWQNKKTMNTHKKRRVKH